VSSTSPLAVLQVVAIAYKLQGEALFAWNAALQEGTLLFFDAFQAPVAQHFAVAGGQAQRLQLRADAAQGVQFFKPAFELV